MSNYCKNLINIMRDYAMPNKLISMTIMIITQIIAAHSFAGDTKSYCAQVKNDDKIRRLTHDIMKSAQKLYPGSEMRFLSDSTVYRCMGGNVWICNYGANIPCDGVGRRKGSAEISSYCRDNPNEDYIPMAVTGHATMYLWSCSNGRPVRVPRKLDARGFQADIWNKIP